MSAHDWPILVDSLAGASATPAPGHPARSRSLPHPPGQPVGVPAIPSWLPNPPRRLGSRPPPVGSLPPFLPGVQGSPACSQGSHAPPSPRPGAPTSTLGWLGSRPGMQGPRSGPVCPKSWLRCPARSLTALVQAGSGPQPGVHVLGQRLKSWPEGQCTLPRPQLGCRSSSQGAGSQPGETRGNIRHTLALFA